MTRTIYTWSPPQAGISSMSCPGLLLSALGKNLVRQVITLCRSLLSVPALVFLMATINATSNAATPSLFIPLGSYLEHFNIGRISYDQGEIYFNKAPFGGSRKLSFEVTDNIPNPGSCWSQGYDLTKGSDTELSCDTTKQRVPEDASRFLYSAPLPYGSYLDKCTGLLKTVENNREYLYASCLIAGWGRGPSDKYYKKNRLDVTDCQNEIISDKAGILKCSNSPVRLRQLLSGSYLASCNLSGTLYDPMHSRMVLKTNCGFLCGPACDDNITNYSLYDAEDCIGSGKDLRFIIDNVAPYPKPSGNDLICVDDSTREVRVHTASSYVPAGNYLLTCRQIAFYPCMGPNRQGVLTAQCLDERGIFQETQLVDGDSECRMSNMGYVSNIYGHLRCDPDIPFNNESPTQRTDLLPHFQCNEE